MKHIYLFCAIVYSALIFTSCNESTNDKLVDESTPIKASQTQNIQLSEETIGKSNNVDSQTTTYKPRNTVLPSCKLSVMTAAFPSASFSAESWSGSSPYAVVNENEPLFSDEEKENSDSFEIYSELDGLGRCGTAFANVCTELMPTEERGMIGMVKPSGWKLSKYDKSIIPDMYLFNRCHLLAYMLTGENANVQNLITGTRYLNVEGMLTFEEKVRNYIYHNPENHVLYRATPVYNDDDLVAQGVLMEAYSVEDNGQLRFCVFCYNVQPYIEIDYSNGDNHLKEGFSAETEAADEQKPATTTVTTTAQLQTETDKDTITIENKSQGFVLNINTKKIHLPSCESVNQMKEKNKKYTDKKVNELIEEGYKPCKICNPQ